MDMLTSCLSQRKDSLICKHNFQLHLPIFQRHLGVYVTTHKLVMCHHKSMIFNNKEDTKNSKASAINVIYKTSVPLNQGKKTSI